MPGWKPQAVRSLSAVRGREVTFQYTHTSLSTNGLVGSERRGYGRVVGNPEVGNSGPECRPVSDGWRLVGAVREIEFKRLQFFASGDKPALSAALIGTLRLRSGQAPEAVPSHKTICESGSGETLIKDEFQMGRRTGVDARAYIGNLHFFGMMPFKTRAKLTYYRLLAALRNPSRND